MMNKFKEKAVELNKNKEKSVIKDIAKANSAKDKMISAKVNSLTYAQFTEINRVFGMSNNSSLNQLIAKYVLENKKVLEEE